MAALDQGRPSRPALSGQTPERRPVGKVRDLQREADELHERFTAARDKGDLDTAKRLQTQGRELDELLTLHRDVKRAQQERDLVADAFDRAKSSGDMETARDLQARGRGLDEQLTIGRSELDRRVRSRVGAAIDQHGVQGVLDAIDSERTGWDTAKDIGKSVLAGTVGMGASALDSAETEFRADRQRGLMQEREAWNAQPDSPEKKQRLTELADIEKRMLAGDYSVSDVFRPPRPRTGKGTTVEEALSGAPIGPGVTADPLGTASTMNDSSDSSFYGLIRGIVNDKNENGQRMLRWQERIAKSRTAAAQEKAAQPWVNEHAQWDQPSTWFDGTKLADPESFAIGMAEIAPSIVPAIGASWVGGRMSALAVARNLRRTGKLDRMGMNAARKRIAAAGAAGGTVAGSGSEYVLMRDAATSQTRQALEAQHGKEEFWDGNAQFQKLLGEGHSREFAKQYLTNRYATLAGDVTGVVGAVLGAPMSRFLGKMGLENAVGRTAGAAKAGVGEALQESLQSTGEQLVQNIAQKNVDPTQPYTKGLLNAFVGGLFGGAGLGAVTGALGGGGDRGEEMLSPEGKRLIEAGFGDWMKLGNERVKLQNRMNDPKYEAKVTPEQRKSDLDQAERLEYEQAEAWLRAEPEIRRQQAKNKDTTAVEIKTTEEYGRQARKSMAAITQRRIDRKAADSELAAEHARTKETEEKAAATSADEQELAAKRQRVADVDTITNGGALEGENVAERYQALIDKGIGRWANATKTEFMITQKGARLSTEERSEVKNLEERLAGNYTGPERRQNRKLRERVAAMSDEELEKFVNQNPVSGMRNRRSYEDTESEEGPARAYASVDVDSLKWVNDNMGGHEKGDELLRTVARAFRNSGLDAYHVGGDEIVVRGETEEAIEAGMQRVAATLRKARPIEGISGQTIQPTVTWATGTDFKSADTKMGETKKTREAEGKRAKRGEPPPSLAEEGQIPPPPPLASDESAEEAGEDYDPDDDKAIDLGVVAERLFGALTLARTEKQTARQRRRVRELEGKYWNLQTLMEETRAEQGLDEGTPISISPRAMRNFYQSARARETDLKIDWFAMSEEERLPYDIKAAEFWSIVTDKHVDPFEVFLFEKGHPERLQKKLIPPDRNANGELVVLDDSLLAQHLTELIESDRLPKALVNKMKRMLFTYSAETGDVSFTPGQFLALHVVGYWNGEFLLGGPHPFSENTKGFDAAHRAWLKSGRPLLQRNMADPIADEHFYQHLAKGDHVEVIVPDERGRPQSVIGIVTNVGKGSAVVTWEAPLVVFDPDTKKMGKRARFALAHGQQVSANLARGGARESLAYQHQLYSFPRQARLGRVWNTAEQHWDTSHDVIRRIGRVTVGGPRSPIRKFRNARYTKPTAREAKIVAHSIDNFLNSFGNLPPIHVVDNVTQLPENLQRRIAINPGNGSSTAGIMNDDDPEDGVYIVMAGLIDSTDRLIREGKMKPEMREAWLAHRARTVALHELVGHWGIRAVMGSDARLEAWMERILIDHEPEVVATAIRRGLMIADPNGKQYMGRDGKPLTDEAGNTKFLWPDHNSRMTAPQEYLAEIAQKKILKLEVSIHERGLLKSIVGAIKSFLIERGFGRFVTVTDDDIEHLIWKSKQFIDSGRAHVYHKGWDGSRRGLMTRDADLFTSAFVNAVESGRRVPSPAEKQQLRAAGIALAPDGMVDLFPKEGLTRAGYQNAIAYMLKNGLASEAEINFMDLEGFVEIVTPWMIWTAGEGKSLPRHAQELGYKMQGFNLFPEDQQDLGKMIKHRDELRAIKKRLESPLTDESYEALIEFHLIDTMPDAPTPQQAAEQLGWQLEGLEAQIGTRFGTGWGSLEPEHKLTISREDADRKVAEWNMAFNEPSTLGKKAKIPRKVIDEYVKGHAIRVSVYPANGYVGVAETDMGATERMDINELNWYLLTNRPTAYGSSNLWPSGTHPEHGDTQGIVPAFIDDAQPGTVINYSYVLYQENPTRPQRNPSGESAHPLRTTRDEALSNNFQNAAIAHLRLAMRMNDDREWELIIVEVQSDAFQKTENAFESQADKDRHSALMGRYEAILRITTKAAVNDLTEQLTEGLRTEFERVYMIDEAMSDSTLRTMPASDLTTQHRQLFEELGRRITRVVDSARTTMMSTENWTAIHEAINAAPQGYRPDDVRAPDYMKQLAYRRTLITFFDRMKHAAANIDADELSKVYGIPLYVDGAYQKLRDAVRDNPGRLWNHYFQPAFAKGVNELTDENYLVLRRTLSDPQTMIDTYLMLLNQSGLATNAQPEVHTMTRAQQIHASLLEKATPVNIKITTGNTGERLARLGFKPEVLIQEALILNRDNLKLFGIDVGKLPVVKRGESTPDSNEYVLELPPQPPELVDHFDPSTMIQTTIENYLASHEFTVAAQSAEQVTTEDVIRSAEQSIEYNDLPADFRNRWLEAIDFEEHYPDYGDDIDEDLVGESGWTFGGSTDEDRDEAIEDALDEMIRDWWNNDDLSNQISDHLLERMEWRGDPLDYDHPGYVNRLVQDEDGDTLDYDIAEEWLREKREEVAKDEAMSRGSDVRQYLMEKGWNNGWFDDVEGPSVDTGLWTFRIPTSFDENGEPDDWVNGAIIRGARDDNGEIHNNYQIFVDGSRVDFWYDMPRSQQEVFEKGMELISEAIVRDQPRLPPGSIWEYATAAAAGNLPEPERFAVSVIAQQAAQIPDMFGYADLLGDIKAEKVDSAELALPEKDVWTAWQSLVRMARREHAVVAPNDPMRESWNKLVLQVAIADAVRRGAKRIHMQSGEAQGSRGGWGDPTDGSPRVRKMGGLAWVRREMPIGGKNIEVYEIESSDGSKFVITPDQLVPVVGHDVAALMRDFDANPQKYARSEETLRAMHLRDLRVVSTGIGGKYLLFDAELGVNHGEFDSAFLAETRRQELVRDLVQAARNNAEHAITRRISAEMVGGPIYLIQPETARNYLDDPASAGNTDQYRLLGARTSYDVVNVSMLNKIVKPFGTAVKPGRLRLRGGEIATSVHRDGGRITTPTGQTMAELKQRFRVEGIGGGRYAVVSDEGLALNQLFDTNGEATRALESLLNTYLHTGAYQKVHTIEMTDALRERYGKGQIPLLSEAGDDQTFDPSMMPARGSPLINIMGRPVESAGPEVHFYGPRNPMSLRAPWSKRHFPEVIANTMQERMSDHPDYAAAKAGDAAAAVRFVRDYIKPEFVEQVRKLLEGHGNVTLQPVLALEATGANQIPLAVAAYLGEKLGMEVGTGILQTGKVQRTGTRVDHRLANSPSFGSGNEPVSGKYLIIDDALSLGGTLASLRGFIEQSGGEVVGGATLFARGGAALLLPAMEGTIAKIKHKHGPAMDQMLREELGYGLDSLTEAEANHVRTAESVDALRNRIVAARIPRQSRQDAGADGGARQPLTSMGSYPNDPDLDSASQKVGVKAPQPPLRQRAVELLMHMRKVFEHRMFDRMSGIKHALKAVGWQGSAADNPYIQARLTTSPDAQMRAVLENGHPIWKDGIMQTEGKGLLEILEPVSDPRVLKLWSLYMVGKRAERLMNEGREHLFTPREIAAMVRIGNMPGIGTTIKRVAGDYARFNKKVLDFAEAAGVINPTTRPLWENADYIPFYRVQDDRLVGPTANGNGIANQRSPITMLKGGANPLGDPVTNIIVNLSTMLESSMKNHAALLAIEALNGSPLISKIPSISFEKGLVPMDQVRKLLLAAGMNPANIPANALTGFQQMFVAAPPKGEGVISVMRDGKPEYYRTDDQLLFESLTMFNQKRFGWWIKLFSGPKRFLTSAITLDPGFMIRNYIRDLFSSYVQSRDVNSPLTHLVKSANGFATAITEGDALKIMRAAGGAFDLGYINVGDMDSTRKAIRKAMRNKGFRMTVLDTPAKLLDLYKSLGAGVENANRIAVYNEAIANGKSVAQAVYEAKDLMDFSMSGSWGVIQFLVQTVPFFGARLQGLHRLGRGMQENPMAFAMKGFLITLAGMALYLRYDDDERFKKLELWDRMTYYHFWIGDQHYRLPKGFEVGSIFNSIPELMTERFKSDEGDANKVLLGGLAHIFSESFSMNPIPQVAQPIVETGFNINFFTRRQIVSPYEEQRIPPEQFSPMTSPLMLELARGMPAWFDSVSNKIRSPKHLENLYRGYTGSIGQYALLAADAAVRHVMDYPSTPEKRLQDMPVVSSFFRGVEDDTARTKYEEVFYDTLRKAQQVKGSLSYLEKMTLDERREYVQENYEAIIAITPQLDSIREQVSDLNAAMMKVWMDPDMTPEAKRREVDDIQKDKNELFRDAYPLRPGGKDYPDVSEETLRQFLEDYDVNKLPSELSRRNAPSLGALVQDVLALEDQDTIRVLARGQP